MAGRATLEASFDWTNVRGRNNWDSPDSLPDDFVVSAINWRLGQTGLGRIRNGSIQAYTSTAGGYNSPYSSMAFQRKYANNGGVILAAFIFGITVNDKLAIASAASSVVAATALTEVVTGDRYDATWQLNADNMWAAYVTAVNRIHLFTTAGDQMRVGLVTPAQPTLADTGAGAYPATLRFYRIQWRIVNTIGGRIVRSLLGAPLGIYPSGLGAALRVTRPATPTGENVSHWVVWGSSDNVTFFKLSGEIAIATTTFDDNVLPSAYNLNELAPEEGAFTPWPAVRYILNAGSRMIGFGNVAGLTGTAFDSPLTSVHGRVIYSPVIGTTDTSDNERISNTLTVKGYTDLGYTSDAEDRGLGGPLQDDVYAFKSRGIYQMTPTGDVASPYRIRVLTPSRGLLRQRFVFMGEDEGGRPCLYFWDPARGPYRQGADGLQWLGYDIQDILARVNFAAATTIGFGFWDPAGGAARWFVALDASDTPSIGLVFDITSARVYRSGEMRGGWTTDEDGNVANNARCGCLAFHVKPSSDLIYDRPVVNNGSVNLVSLDYADATTDWNGTTVRGVLTSRAVIGNPRPLVRASGKLTVQAQCAVGSLIQCYLVGDFDPLHPSLTGQQSFDPSVNGSTNTRAVREFSEVGLANFIAAQVVLISLAPSIQVDWAVLPLQALLAERGNAT